MMRRLLSASALALCAAALVAPSAMAQPVCLPTYYIDHTHVVNDRTILFRMKDGKVWENQLQNRCPGLNFHGFAYVVHTDEVCGSMQSIRVIQTGETCLLGPFSPAHPDHAETTGVGHPG